MPAHGIRGPFRQLVKGPFIAGLFNNYVFGITWRTSNYYIAILCILVGLLAYLLMQYLIY